ncbi:MAG: hypothetical protein NTV11_16555 [Rhodocyclales bacterium]|nr:hypothetical protein [Rhodocyclales bacterium]
MSQNRDAPAYQEYAASMMAKMPYREMNLQQRGLLYTMRNECWVNSLLPSEPGRLAKVLGLDADEVAAALPAVMSFFRDDGRNILSPELEDYRAHLADQKARMAKGGKRGAETTNGKRKPAKKRTGTDDPATSAAPPTATPQPARQGGDEVLVQSSSVQQSQTQSPVKDSAVDPFVADYVAAEQRETSKRIRVVV